MTSPVLTVIAAAFLTGILAPVVAFTALIIGRIRRRGRADEGPRCLQCEGPLVPLLDGSHRFLGEAACADCGRLHEGLQASQGPASKQASGRMGEVV
ncbi:MAG: hypothetical protein HYT80_11365 [Euryarchaeota archaeon]|nr:hypothetical protein [Euryarchaeota archaeon]